MGNFFLVSYLVFLNLEIISHILKNWKIYHVFSKIGKYILYFQKNGKNRLFQRRGQNMIVGRVYWFKCWSCHTAFVGAWQKVRMITSSLNVLVFALFMNSCSPWYCVSPPSWWPCFDARLLHGVLVQVMVLADMMEAEVKVVVTKEAGQARYMIDKLSYNF